MPILDRLLSVVAPHACLGCGAEGVLLCAWCKPDAFPALPSRCYRCQRVTVDSATCTKCLKRAAPRHVWVATGYESIAKELIHNFKFERMRAAAPIIAEAMCGILPFLKPDTLVVPVPTATARIRQRGYDHAELLARHIAKNRGLCHSRAVSRLTQSRQVGASRSQRITQLKDAFVAKSLTRSPRSAKTSGLELFTTFLTKNVPTRYDFCQKTAENSPSAGVFPLNRGIGSDSKNLMGVKGADVLVVDDVITTGATLEAVTLALKLAGAKTVNAVVFTQQQ